MPDPLYNYVVLHLPAVPADSTDSPRDYSQYRRTFTSSPNCVTSTNAKYGAGSIRVGTHLLKASMTNVTMGTQDFTAEAWFRADAVAAASQFLFATGDNGNRGLDIGFTDGGKLFMEYYINGGTYVVEVGTVVEISPNTYYHMALERYNNTMKLYLNGVLKLQKAILSTDTIVSSPHIRLGNIDFGQNLAGYLDDVRFTLGVARYQGAFTPPDAIEYSEPPSRKAAIGVFGVKKFNGYDTNTISGTVAVSPNTPVRRMVRLYHKRSGQLLDYTWSDLAGNYTFAHAPSDVCFVTAHDHTSLYDAVVRDNIVPLA